MRNLNRLEYCTIFYIRTTKVDLRLNGRISDFFLLNALKAVLKIKNVSHQWRRSVHFFPKSLHFFSFLKKGHAKSYPLTPSCPSGYMFDILTEKSCLLQFRLNLFMGCSYIWKNFTLHVLIKLFL